MRKNIVVTPYSAQWPALFAIESDKIQRILGVNCVAIHHVGSTSVPGLSAKPIIDIITVVKDPEKAITPLETLGFTYKGEYNIPMRFYFSRSIGVEANLHLYEEDHPEIELNLTFRDYLRSHTEARDEYLRLKEDLLKDKSSYEKANSSFTGYNLGKDAFIRKILKRAGFNRLRMLRCTHYAEWDAVKKFRKKYFKSKLDPYVLSLDQKEHNHLIFYQGMEIIGYMHSEFLQGQTAITRLFVIDEPYLPLAGHFLSLYKHWLYKQGINESYDTSTHTE